MQHSTLYDKLTTNDDKAGPILTHTSTTVSIGPAPTSFLPSVFSWVGRKFKDPDHTGEGFTIGTITGHSKGMVTYRKEGVPFIYKMSEKRFADTFWQSGKGISWIQEVQ